MNYFLNILSVLVAVLAVLFISLFVVLLLILNLNSMISLPDFVFEFSKDFISDKNIGNYLGVLTSIVALLFPISVNIVSDIKSKYFLNADVSYVIFGHWTFFWLKGILCLLIFLTSISFLTTVPKWLLIISVFGMITSLIIVFFYLKRLKLVIVEFTEIVRKKEKIEIEELV